MRFAIYSLFRVVVCPFDVPSEHGRTSLAEFDRREHQFHSCEGVTTIRQRPHRALVQRSHVSQRRSAEPHLIPLDDGCGRRTCPIMGPWNRTNRPVDRGSPRRPNWLPTTWRCSAPRSFGSTTSGVAQECLAKMQADVVQLALDLLVREPDVEGFFGALTKNMVEESDSHALRRLAARRIGRAVRALDGLRRRPPVRATASDDLRRCCRSRTRAWPIICSRTSRDGNGRSSTPMPTNGCRRRSATSPRGRVCTPRSIAPLIIGNRTLGWIELSRVGRAGLREHAVVARRADRGDRAAGGAGAAPQPRCRATAGSKSGARRFSKNATASRATFTTTWRRDSRAILMQLQAAQRESAHAAAAVAAEARDGRRSGAHAHDRSAAIGRRASAERRRRRGHRPALKRLADLGQRTTHGADRHHRRRAAALRRRRRARDHRHRAGGAHQRRAPLARAAHHDRRVDRAVGRPAAVGRRRWPRHRARSVVRPGSA